MLRKRTNMNERNEQMYWLENRGVILALPPVSHPDKEPDFIRQTRLAIISSDSIMLQRYPKAEDGQSYMATVDFSWREELHSKAMSLTNQIVAYSAQINPEKNIAVILFGSVAKNLSRSRRNLDPSNIDLSVIGNFNDSEKENLFTKIRPVRIEGESEIGNNIGVHIQTPETVTNGNYAQSILYIGSSARTLHDPANIWTDIETETLTYLFIKNSWEKIKAKLRAYKKLYRLDGMDLSKIEHSDSREVGAKLIIAAQERPEIREALKKCAEKANLANLDLVEICQRPEMLLRSGKKYHHSSKYREPTHNSSGKQLSFIG